LFLKPEAKRVFILPKPVIILRKGFHNIFERGFPMTKNRLLLMYSLFSLSLTSCHLFSPSETENTETPDKSTEDVEEIASPEQEPDPIPEEDAKNTVSFYALGDNLIHQQIFEYAQTDDQAYDFKPIYHLLSEQIANADLAFINQESIIGGDALGFSGYPAFNTPSDMTENLVDLGFDIVNGSNNHTLDKGTTGVQNTLNYWEPYSENVLFTGVFASQEDRDTIQIVEKNGLKFAVLAYTYGTNGLVPDESYQLNYFDPDLITQDVARAQELSDFVIVSAHWGDEHAFEPNQMQYDYAQLFADLDVDVVVGNHSHTIQPIEWVTGADGNETLIIYSLGNALASTISDRNLLGGSIQFDFVAEDEELSIENVSFNPHVIHYEEAIRGDILSRTNFEIYPLADYPEEKAAQHALVGFEDNVISVEKSQQK